MEYIYFLLFVAAIGLIFSSYGIANMINNKKTESSIFSGRRNDVSNAEAIPPVKKTISGLSAREIEHMRFQERIDIWQKEHEVRYAKLFKSSEPVTGKKYTFKPPQKTRVVQRPVDQPKTGSLPNMQKWQLIG
mgnify:FL=1